MIKAFIFDLDGTLIDSEVLWCKSLQRVIEARNLPITEAYTYELVFGRAWSDIVGRLRKDYPSLRDDDGALELEALKHYRALRGTTDIRIPSSIQLLERLARRYPVAIVSGSTRQQVSDAIAMMGVAGKLKFYLGSEDYPRGKPDPLCFLLAAQRFGVEPEECLVFEDSSAGVGAALAAGMTCIALQRHGHSSQDVGGATITLADLADFNAARYGITLD
jgi:HAD superfamily hydrolase (TIGR01509 family)